MGIIVLYGLLQGVNDISESALRHSSVRGKHPANLSFPSLSCSLYLLITCYVPGAVLGTGFTALRKTNSLSSQNTLLIG